MPPEIGDIVTAEGDTGPVSATREESGVLYVRLRRVDAPWQRLDIPAPPSPEPVTTVPAETPASKAGRRERQFPNIPPLEG